jgi:hypothetical protein
VALDLWSKRAPTPAGWYAYAAVYLAAVFIVGVTMAAAIEFPVLRLRDRLIPRTALPIVIVAESSSLPSAPPR